MSAPIINGNVADADSVMNAMASIWNDTAQNLFNQAYIGFDSKLNGSGAPDLKNVEYSIFDTDDADSNFGFIYDSVNDRYEMTDLSAIGTEYVIIEATSYNDGWVNGTNDTSVIQISDGKWLVYCDTGTDAVQRAQIIKSLFNSTGGLILDFTSITAIKTSHLNDVGKQAHYATISKDGGSDSTYTGTFLDTTNNTNCSSWSSCYIVNAATVSRWELPSGTTRNSISGSNFATSDELGTDTSGDENSNPANCQFELDFGTSLATGQAIILCSGGITWSSLGSPSVSNIDFYTTHSIPLMTAAGSLASEGVGDGTLIFKDTVVNTDNAIPVINSTIDATSSEQISVSANGGSNWTDVDNAEIARPTAGTALWRRIVITRTDLSKIDKVTEQAVKYNLY